MLWCAQQTICLLLCYMLKQRSFCKKNIWNTVSWSWCCLLPEQATFLKHWWASTPLIIIQYFCPQNQLCFCVLQPSALAMNSLPWPLSLAVIWTLSQRLPGHQKGSQVKFRAQRWNAEHRETIPPKDAGQEPPEEPPRPPGPIGPDSTPSLEPEEPDAFYLTSQVW